MAGAALLFSSSRGSAATTVSRGGAAATTTPAAAPPATTRTTTRTTTTARRPAPRLVFTSWWQEMEDGQARRREVEIAFKAADCSVVVTLNRMRDTEYHLSHLLGKYGPVEACDLYVGAKVNVLGRAITLRQANLETLRWLDAEAQRLGAEQATLLNELASYGVVIKALPSGKRCLGTYDGGRTRNRPFSEMRPDTRVSLRATIRDNAFLRDHVARYKPAEPTHDTFDDLF